MRLHFPVQALLRVLTASRVHFEEQIDAPEDALVIAEGCITAPAQYGALMDMVRDEGLAAAFAGLKLLERFESSDSADDLNNAIDFLEKAVACMAGSNPPLDARCSRMTNLGGAYGARYERTGATPDLERAIELTREALDFMVESSLAPDHLPFLASAFTGLETWLSVRFKRFGSSKDLREAVGAAEMAVNLTTRDNPDWPGRANDLGLRLDERFHTNGEKEDLDRAIEFMIMAVDTGAKISVPRGVRNPNTANLLNLGMSLSTRFKLTGVVEDLDRAVEALEAALETSLPKHSMRCSILNNLAVALAERCEQTGSDHDLDRAIDLEREAVDTTPKGHPDRVDRVSNLGIWLEKRARQTGSMIDLDHSIEVSNAAIRALPVDHPERARLLMGLGNSLNTRCDRTHSVLDLDAAIEAEREAVSLIPPGHHIRAAMLNNLASLLGKRAESEEIPELPETTDLLDTEPSNTGAEAVAMMRLSVEMTEEGHTDRPGRLCNLGNLLGRQFLFRQHTSKDLDTINDAIEVTRQAVDTSPRANPQRAQFLFNLGTWLAGRHAQTDAEKDQIDALKCYQEGWELQNATPYVRILLARKAAIILAARSNWKEADQLLEGAIKLLPSVTPRSLRHTDKQDMLAKFTGLASMAAAVALNAGRSEYEALRLLELGRGVIASLLLEMRGDISDLKAKHPSLAAEFLALRDELDSPGHVPASADPAHKVTAWELQARKRRESERRFSELVQEIQTKRGFRHFCGVPDEDELKAAAGSGPLVIINVAPYRCDAFLVQHDKISVLELPDLDLGQAKRRLSDLRLTTHLGGSTELLEWLWTSTTGPCLDALNFTSPIVGGDSARWPRIWWIPTGPLSRFPLHAAGRHQQGAGETVLDRVMSSYALSLRTLIYGRRTARHAEPKPGPGATPAEHAVLLAMPTTPGLRRDGALRWAQREVDMVAGLCPALGLQRRTPEPRRDAVLDGLRACRVFHFAGHGQSVAAEPSRSCLLLQDWQTHPLTVADLRDRRLQKQQEKVEEEGGKQQPPPPPPFLGYLSACSTGANEAPQLADEGIHLISALQLAGFRHVVGTLWEVSDQHCVDVARVFYETLGEEGMTDEAVCRGLHRAMKMLRDGCIDGVPGNRKALCIDHGTTGQGTTKNDLVNGHWIPYVHFGV